jgi:CheY-like chemotaxis protein
MSDKGQAMSLRDDTEESWLAAPARPLVLVVDDDDAIREALGDLLQDAGFDTVGARNGLEALNILAALATAPTFILLDLTMPVMDGWAFCETRRKNRLFSEVPVIAISAGEISESDRPAGIDAFLAKPIDLERFAQLAIRVSGRRRSRERSSSVLH